MKSALQKSKAAAHAFFFLFVCFSAFAQGSHAARLYGINENAAVDVSAYSKGIYFIKATGTDGNVYRINFAK